MKLWSFSLNYLHQKLNMRSWMNINFMKPIVVVTLMIFNWFLELIDQKYIAVFLFGFLLRPFFADNTILNELDLSIRHFLATVTKKINADNKRNPNNLRFLVIGRSKSGKRLTVESFVQRKCAETESTAPGLTSARNLNSFGWDVYALVCRCFQDTVDELSEKLLSAKSFLKNALTYKVHVVIYCFPYSEGLTDEDREFIEALKTLLQSTKLKNCIILAMTHGEIFEATKKGVDFESFNHWIKEMDPCILKSVLEECSNRCVMFQNKTESGAVKKQQAVELFKMAENIVWENGLISSDSISVKGDYMEKKETFSKEFTTLLPNECEPLTVALNNADNQREICHIQSETSEFMQLQKMNGLHTISARRPLVRSFFMSANCYRRHEETFITLGCKQYEALQPFFCTLKENIRSEEFTDIMYQENILTYEEKREIDETTGIVKRKDALFDAIHKHSNKGSVDVFLKILEEKYPSLYENWNALHGQQYRSLNGHFKTESNVMPLHVMPLQLTE